MGNCIDHQRVYDEDWGLIETSSSRKKKVHASEHEGSSSSSSSSTSTVIKVKLTKRQLEELLQRANARGAMDVRQMLEQAIDVGTISGDAGGARRGWAPRLESIDEAAEDEGEL